MRPKSLRNKQTEVRVKRKRWKNKPRGRLGGEKRVEGRRTDLSGVGKGKWKSTEVGRRKTYDCLQQRKDYGRGDYKKDRGINCRKERDRASPERINEVAHWTEGFARKKPSYLSTQHGV